MKKTIVAAALISSFLLSGCEKKEERWARQTEELLRSEYRTSRIYFDNSFYTNKGYGDFQGAVCGKVAKIDHDEDDVEFRHYYALVIDDGDNILKVTDVDFDIYVSLERWEKHCQR
ncbi:hypothetical protein ACF3TM_18320 [Providencia stuartii]|uniref:hypothetical protein n=1 Tax=Providencia stuartii TaxID=588 RepID=UPI00370A0731